MKDVGLSLPELEMLRAAFRRHPEIARVVLYGSRAKGAHRPESDVDLTVHGFADPLRAEALAAELDDLPLPYRFDVNAYDAIASDVLRDHIHRVGVEVYNRDVTLPTPQGGLE